MERTVRQFASFEEADAADKELYRRLTPDQRIEILLQLMKQARGEGDAAERLERVVTVVQRERS